MDLGVAPDRVYHRRTAAFELHDLEIDAGHRLEVFDGKMTEAAGTRCRTSQFTWLLLRERDELFHRIYRNSRIDGEHVRPAAHLGNRGKGLDRIVRYLVERRVGSKCSSGEKQRVTVRLRLR